MSFINQYAAFIGHPALEFLIPSIDPTELHRSFTSMTFSAPGLDAWGVPELKHLTLRGATLLAQLFEAIELGAPWPGSLCLSLIHI
eukprot:8545182-Alexandrium_andersonii.AAC.1